MGWTCGFGISSALDVARYYYDLLGPEKKILSKEYTDEMQQFSTLDLGWSRGNMDYGAGLFVINPSPHHGHLPSLNDTATYVGHEGDTYGFESTQGFNSHINASMSLIVNVDWNYPRMIMCTVYQVVFKHKGIEYDLDCPPVRPDKFGCSLHNGKPGCSVTHSLSGGSF